MPSERWSLGTCVVDGKIFAIGGGVSASYGSSTTNEVYDPITDVWTTKSPMQQKRYGLYVCSVGNKIYAIGGSVPTILSTVEEYDTGLGIPSPDFNGDYVIDIEDLIILIESWKQNDPSCDIAPAPFGDGIVDVLDLELLMSYWEQEVPDPTLIAHWKLDETEGNVAYDSAGDTDGDILADAVWHPDGGQVDGALEFDGINDYISTPFIFDPAKGDFSVFAWIKGGAPGQVIIYQQGGADWLMADAIDGALRTDLKQPAGSGRDAAPVGPPLISSTFVTDSHWHRVGFIRDGSNRILYVDDVEVARDTANNLESAVGGLHIGTGNATQPGTFFSGLIDDVRIYNRVVEP
jgi:hypothetical protein